MRRRSHISSGTSTLVDNSETPAKSAWHRLRRRLLPIIHHRPLIATILLLLICILYARLHRPNPRIRPASRRCIGQLLPVSPIRGAPGRALVSVGDCSFQFLANAQCPSLVSTVAAALRVAALPCTNATLLLESSMSGRFLRAFGVRSRSSSALPRPVVGVLLPSSAVPFPALTTPDSRPYFWAATVPSASTCRRGHCRALIRAMLLAYIAGCDALPDGALWRMADAADERGLLLAFPRKCGRAGRDTVAEDILLRYLRATCEIPQPLWRALRGRMLKHLVNVAEERVAYISGAIGARTSWSLSASATRICIEGMHTYMYDAWKEDASVMTALGELDAVRIEKENPGG